MPLSSGRAFRSPQPTAGFENADTINSTKALLYKAHGELQSALREVQLARQEASSAREEAAAAKRDRDALVREMELLHVSSASLEREVAALTKRLAEQYEQVVAKKSRAKRERDLRLAAMLTIEEASAAPTAYVETQKAITRSPSAETPSWQLIDDEYEEGREREVDKVVILPTHSVAQKTVMGSNLSNNKANRINTANLSIVALNATSSVVKTTVDVSSVCVDSSFAASAHYSQNSSIQPSTLLSPISKGRSDLVRLQRENERLAAAIMETERKSPTSRPEASSEVKQAPLYEHLESEGKTMRRKEVVQVQSDTAPWTANSVLRTLL
jgi:hypothetical protein